MANFRLNNPTPEGEYVFDKPEVKSFAERMVRVSGESYGWDDFLRFAEEFKELVDKYGRETEVFTSEYFKLWIKLMTVIGSRLLTF